MNISMLELERIKCVARVPGRRIAIVIEGKENLHLENRELKISELASHLGNNETINIIKLNQYKQLETQINILLRYFGFKNKPLITHVNNGTQTVVYLRDIGYKQTEQDSLDLIQQILNIHIILK